MRRILAGACAPLSALALAACAFSGAAAPEPTGIPGDAFTIVVDSVHDGDTLRARVGEPNDVMTDTGSTRVRLLGIDAPEVSPAEDCGAAEARKALVALAPPGSTLWAAADVEVRDRYDRPLLHLWTTDGVFINAELVSTGAARVMIYEPNDAYEALLRALEDEASARGAGQWGACG